MKMTTQEAMFSFLENVAKCSPTVEVMAECEKMVTQVLPAEEFTEEDSWKLVGKVILGIDIRMGVSEKYRDRCTQKYGKGLNEKNIGPR
jgi:hypothetical protein